MKQSFAYTFTFPPQQHHFDPGDTASDPVEGGTRLDVTEIDDARRHGRAPARQRGRATSRFPRRSSPAARTTPDAAGGAPPPRRLDARRRRPLPRACALLRREPPARAARRCSASEHRRPAGARRRPRRSYLFVQGPPGSGKTYAAPRLIIDAAPRREAGRRRGAEPQGDPQPARRGRARGRRGTARLPGPEARAREYEGGFIRQRQLTHEFADPEFALVAGTAWLFAREELDQTLDKLVIDEAGQISLADALAMGTSARDSSCSATRSSSPRSRRASTRPARARRSSSTCSASTDDPRGPRHLPRRRPGGCIPTCAGSSPRRSTRAGSTRSPSARERSTSTGRRDPVAPGRARGNRVESAEEADAIAAEIERAPGRDVHRPRTAPAAARCERTSWSSRPTTPRCGSCASACRPASRSAPSTSSRAARRRSSSTRWRPRAARTCRAGSSSCSRATA